MTYEQALAFWFGHINYEQRTPAPSDLKLDRMRTLLRALGDPQDRLRIVHVAGSKGKGSTSAMLAAILQQAGYRTGLFTSPHLCRVEERFQIAGQNISAHELTSLMEAVQAAIPAPDESCRNHPVIPSSRHPVTFFEIATALGFLHFARRRVDVAVIEVGLGGRFDSTNVCRPLVALITSISLDHTRQLGNRLASIAMEKAGIVKPGRPVLSGATVPEAREVIEQICRDRGAPLRQLGSDFHYTYEPGLVRNQGSGVRGQGSGVRGQESGVRDQGSDGKFSDSCLLTPDSWCRRPNVCVVTERRAWPVMEMSLLGEHQAANAALTVACVEQLRAEGLCIPDEAVAAGLEGVRWPARLEVVGPRPLVVLDCAHNVASVQVLVESLNASFPPARRLLVFAASNDKDLDGMFRVLVPHFAHVYLTRYGTSARSATPEQLAELLQRVSNLPFTVCPTAAAAWQAARSAADPDDLLCVTGSVFLAGELRPLLVSTEIVNGNAPLAHIIRSQPPARPVNL